MSNLKRKMEIDKIKRLIFEMLNEQPSIAVPGFGGDDGDGTAPNPEAHETRVEREIRQREERIQNFNAAYIEKLKKYVPDVVSKEIIDLEKDLKKYMLALLYKKSINHINEYFSGVREEYLGIPSLMSTSEEFEEFESDLNFDAIESDIRQNIEKEDITMILSLKVIYYIVSSISVKLVEENNGGGPLANHSILLNYKNKDYLGAITAGEQYTGLDDFIKEVFVDITKEEISGQGQKIIDKSDSFIKSWNQDTWFEFFSYIYDEMRGASYDNPSFILSIVNSLTTGDIPTIYTDSKIFTREENHWFTNLLNQSFYVGWTLSGWVGTVLSLGSVGARGTTIRALAGSLIKSAAIIVVIGLLMQLIVAGTRMLVESATLIQKVNTVEKIFKEINKKIQAEVASINVLQQINNMETDLEKLVITITNNVKNSLSQDFYNIESNFRHKSIERQKEVDRLNKQKDDLRKSLNNQVEKGTATRYDGKFTSSYRDSSGKRYSANYGSPHFTREKNEFSGGMENYNKKLEETDSLTPYEVAFFKNEISKKDNALCHVDMIGKLIDSYIATYVTYAVSIISQEIDSNIPDIYSDVEECIKSFKNTLESGKIKAISKPAYDQWELDIKKETIVSDALVKNNNNFKVKIIKEE